MFSRKDTKHKVNSNAAVSIREIEYSIRIRDKDSSFPEMMGILKDELTPFRKVSRNNLPGTDNAISDFIQTNIERSISIRENTRIYFLGYKEREGSLRISFTVLLITRYIHYASLRQELDSLIKDTIADYFEELLERHMPVNVSVQSNDNEIVTLTDLDAGTQSSQRPRFNGLTWLMALIALLISVALSIFVFISMDLKTENAKLKEEYIDKVLDMKIQEAVKDQELTIKLYKIADTLNSTPKIISVPPAR